MLSVEKQFQNSGFIPLQVAYQLTPDLLEKDILAARQGLLADSGAIAIDTGKFTGRSPQDRFIVKDATTEHSVEWGGFNTPFCPEKFDRLHEKMTHYLHQRPKVWARDVQIGADARYRYSIRVINEFPAHNLFVYNMFLPFDQQGSCEQPEWLILHAPGFEAHPQEDGTRQGNFSIIHFTKKTILIGGSAYTGEIKKGMFSVLNFILPQKRNVLSMHCSANKAKDSEDVALFFGLSGTGKTTLSADSDRLLIGDDEHGWSDEGVFNFEGGCYAKCIQLSAEKEPFIFNAIKKGALLENIRFYEGTNKVNFEDSSVTENTRVSYPISYIPNALQPSLAGVPDNIFFLTCDAFGILPPVARLSEGQAMYHFLSGYTAKVAGTEAGVKEPVPVFSYCFGAPFLPLSPLTYARMLGEKMQKYHANVWLINTGWSGGPYGVGKRMPLQYTRAIIQAILSGKLKNASYHNDPIFGIAIPEHCADVPKDILDPIHTWSDKAGYKKQAQALALLFYNNFKKYAGQADPKILAAQPKYKQE